MTAATQKNELNFILNALIENDEYNQTKTRQCIAKQSKNETKAIDVWGYEWILASVLVLSLFLFPLRDAFCLHI